MDLRNGAEAVCMYVCDCMQLLDRCASSQSCHRWSDCKSQLQAVSQGSWFPASTCATLFAITCKQHFHQMDVQE